MTSSKARHASHERRKPRPVPPPSGRAAPRDVYSRFIPREELSSFASWSFGDVSGFAAPADVACSARERRSRRADPAETASLSSCARARQSGYQDGYRDGLVALEGFKQSFAAQTTAQIGALVPLDRRAARHASQQEMARPLAAHRRCAGAPGRCAANSTRVPSASRRSPSRRSTPSLLSARHMCCASIPTTTRVIAGRRPTRSRHAARASSPTPRSSRGGCRVESDIGLVDATHRRRAGAAPSPRSAAS